MTVLEAHNIRYDIKDRTLFEINHLSISLNDRIGLVGKNGSGKTSLLNILNGTLTPDNGTVNPTTDTVLLPQLKSTDTHKSGGEVTQSYIVSYLDKQSGILFADEPTTNLDSGHMDWLKNKLSHFKGAVILVSHDRDFLDDTCNTIWEINDGSLKVYSGNYSSYKQQKNQEIESQKLAHQHYEQKKSQLERAIKKKEIKAERAVKTPKSKIGSTEEKLKGAKPHYAKRQKKLQKTTKSIETRIENLEKIEKVVEETPIKMSLPDSPSIHNKIILRALNLDGHVPGKQLWADASFNIYSRDKVGVIGANGAGKTTLLRQIIKNADGITPHPALKTGYFKQNLSDLNLEHSILENVMSTSVQEETLVRTILARLHFYRDDVHKKVSVLSGGERVKAALAKLMVSDINMMILDEPTNYLDITAMEALEALIKAYPGTVLFVSHDRHFVKNTASKIIRIQNKQLTLFDGTLEEMEHVRPKKENTAEQDLMMLETKISEILGKLCIEPTEALEEEFQKLIKDKRIIEDKIK